MHKAEQASGLRLVARMSGIARAGYSQAGICSGAQLQAPHVALEISESETRALDQDTPVIVRTSVALELAGNSFIFTLADIVMPQKTETVAEKSLTSPFSTRASVSEFLRDYYVIREVSTGKSQQGAGADGIGGARHGS